MLCTKGCNYYQLFHSHIPRGSTKVALLLFASVWSLRAQTGGVRKQGQIRTSNDDCRREATSWPDETLSHEEPFIFWAIAQTLYPLIINKHYPTQAMKHSIPQQTFSRVLLFDGSFAGLHCRNGRKALELSRPM